MKGNIAGEWSESVSEWIGSVSYTHLDVYKRQVIILVTSSFYIQSIVLSDTRQTIIKQTTAIIAKPRTTF